MLKRNVIIFAVVGLALALAGSAFGQKNRGSRKTNNARVASPAINPESNVPVDPPKNSLGRANSIECLNKTQSNQTPTKVPLKRGRENSIECLKDGGSGQTTGSQLTNPQNVNNAPGSQTNILPYVEQQTVKNPENSGNTKEDPIGTPKLSKPRRRGRN